MPKTSMHEYKSDPQSGAGNCTCGQAERHRDHFHTFVTAMTWNGLCACALPESATCHIEMVWINENEVMAKSLVEDIQTLHGYFVKTVMNKDG